MTHPHPTVLTAIALALLLGACNANLSAPQAASPQASAKPATSSDADLLARGEYLVRITGCNDCHTAGYTEKAGDLPTRPGCSARHWAIRGRGAPRMRRTCACASPRWTRPNG